MRQYFEQFGTINKLRLSRNKKTGAMKHYGFIEFAESSTAEIVAKTMDNYLLFGHILKVKLVPKSQIHDSLWKGANKRFRAKPHNKIEGSNLKKPRSEAKWEVSISKEYKKRAVRAQKLKKMGYEFEAPELKAVVHAPGEAMTLEEGDEAPKTIEVAPEATSAEAKVPFSADEELGDGIESMDDDTVVTTAKKMTKEDGKGGKKVKKFSKVKKTKKTKKVKA
ncbi:uncharacterized protein BCR38DRAFT_206403 [Pseudomassariella vexata]|uniref:RRM domain-containing protein n=1 Tax=Pseudomassariella vexata TaxID=1141098 RepID=A0A1Y2DXR1_9PEZI|nr:uncharacterized protein BCR38DRAFT_206403 [Pseudomassariella vexata]ORY64090.1 hypothetical protein BCR38DRAFT_206403 [Pseudomassariella vexata]